tara:strand:+ start:7994 stop:8881 length:888 start_codon:yes stop_codon:yes gene_type:complete
MDILISGGTGFIGTPLVDSLLEQGHAVTILTRQQGLPSRARVRYIHDVTAIGDDAIVDAIINLAGASLAAKRWTSAYKEELLQSRLRTTEQLVALCARLQRPPAVVLSASAIGFYGQQSDNALDETSETVPGFAQSLCQQWEDSAARVADSGARVCMMRFGVVLGPEGGALAEMARPFRMGIANWVGSGEQYLSWVHRQDVIAAIQFLLVNASLEGPFNVTAPNPVTSREFCAALKKRFRTLLTLPVPGFVMRTLLGEMADELLINGQRVVPARLQSAGFTFAYPQLDDALADIL